MNEIWVVLEQQEGVLSDVCWELVTHGRGIADKLKGSLYAVVMGWDLSAVGERVRHGGVDEVYLLESPELEANLPQTAYQISTTVTEAKLIRDVVNEAFGKALQRRPTVRFNRRLVVFGVET